MSSTLKAQLKLFNSLGRQLEAFEPLVPGRARIYTCGLTVYNYAHIGNFRAYVFADTLRRALQCKGYDVLHVVNITDVGHLTSDADLGEDKVETAAKKAGRSVWDITRHYTEDFQEQLRKLNVQQPGVEPKATEHIQEMIAFAQQLEAGGYTYALPDGLYFDTSRVPDYGRLGVIDVAGLQEGKRVDTEGKRNPTDFAIWRCSPKDKQRLMEWDSPWGVGAPGWHLECSVMSMKYLGERFDIHTGGVDHQKVHHCNEIAQNQGFARGGDGGVRYWLHNEFLLFENMKMSKSSGDFIRLQSLEGWGIHPLVYRYFLLQTHYRSQVEFTADGLRAAKAGLQRLVRRIRALRERAGTPAWWHVFEGSRYTRGGSLAYAIAVLSSGFDAAASAILGRFDEAMSADLNSAQLLAVLSQTVQESNLEPDVVLRLVAIGELALGLRLLDLEPEELNLRPASAAMSDADIERLIAERKQARDSRDWKRADAIRSELGAAGIELQDNRETGRTEWEWLPAFPKG
ncbi:MAG TPA: cysteine--tRNA ligase [Polyangiales bacterium]|nr:cysteine--tRNA ligase [Polyangiales bacterium]